MTTTNLPVTAIQPISNDHISHRRLKPPRESISFVKHPINTALVAGFKPHRRRNLVKQFLPKSSNVNVERLVDFLYEELPRFFDDEGVDWTVYDERITFQDPVTKHDNKCGYLFNMAMLKMLFSPNVRIHWVKKTGTYEITTRWTAEMTFSLLPWKPMLVLTGTSVMGINPENGKFCSHVDYWDSVKNNEYFFSEAVQDLVKQLRIYKTPDLETPKYQTLKRTATYEVRNYSPFVIVETKNDKVGTLTGFDDVTGFISGNKSREEKTTMSIQVVLPSEKDLTSLPDPNKDDVSLRSLQGGFAAVINFSGKPTKDIVRKQEKLLRSTLLSDGLKPKVGYLLARFNDPGRTNCFTMRNEVLIWLEDFSLD